MTTLQEQYCQELHLLYKAMLGPSPFVTLYHVCYVTPPFATPGKTTALPLLLHHHHPHSTNALLDLTLIAPPISSNHNSILCRI